jgi:Zn finger protein HypA/HybF involved in hydrogenase expression
VERIPWELECLECGRNYRGDGVDAPCPCGSERIRPDGSDEITLVSLEVDGMEEP